MIVFLINLVELSLRSRLKNYKHASSPSHVERNKRKVSEMIVFLKINLVELCLRSLRSRLKNYKHASSPSHVERNKTKVSEMIFF